MKLCGLDIETPQGIKEYSLQPWRVRTGQATIKTIALYSEDKAVRRRIANPSRSTLIELLEECADHAYVMAGWNLVFDVSWLCAYDLVPYLKKLKWLDGMLLLKRYNPWQSKEEGGIGFGLKENVSATWPDLAAYAIDATTVATTAQELQDMLVYNYKDAKYATKLTRLYWGGLSKSERVGAWVECGNIVDVALSYVNGICINKSAITPFHEDINKRIAENEEILGHDISVVRSPKQLANLIFTEWNYEPVNKTPKGEPATDKESLLRLAIKHEKDPRFNALLALRKCNTQGSKFVQSVIKSAEYHGADITRPEPIMSGTYSHRFTYASYQGKGKDRRQTGIALHQWERGKNARDILTAPEGFLLAEFDFSGQEMRLMAIESEDPIMLDLFGSGGDGHALMGANIENLDYEYVKNNSDSDPRAKAARNLGKFCVLEGQPVLTDRGLVPIEDVLITDKVWDGVEWVSHGGAVFQGERDVIKYQGIWLTPDHIVWLTDGSQVEFQEAASKGLQIAITGDGGNPVVLLDNKDAAFSIESADSGRNPRSIPQPGKLEAKRVWDITNAGCRNRYTVCGLLISNSNLSLQYRIGIDTMMSRALTQYNLQLWRAKAEHIKKTYLSTYKRVPVYWKEAVRRANIEGYAFSRGGARVPLSNLNDYQQQQIAINFRIQGTGAEMKLLGINMCRSMFDEDLVYGWDLHDALFMYVRDDANALAKVKKIQKILSNLPYKEVWGWDIPIPLPVDAKLGKTWGSLKGV